MYRRLFEHKPTVSALREEVAEHLTIHAERLQFKQKIVFFSSVQSHVVNKTYLKYSLNSHKCVTDHCHRVAVYV